MKRYLSPAVLAAAVFVSTGAAPPAAAPEKPSPVLSAMKAELDRSWAALASQPTPPYFLSYEITENDGVFVRAAFGTLISSTRNRRRQLDVDLRVGDYALDNSHRVRGTYAFPDRQTQNVPLDDDAAAIRSVLWLQTEQRYKRALEQLTKVKTNVKVMVDEEDRAGDFSKETAESYLEPVARIKLDRAPWEERLRRCTRAFAKHGDIYEGYADLSVNAETRWYASSEGALIQTSQPYYRVSLYGMTKASDGMELPRYESFSALDPEGLPSEAKLVEAAERMVADLHALQQAPLVEPYAGPAILSGRAASVFLHEIFGHRVEGHRQKDVEEGQTFKKQLNQRVLPETLSIHFDPTVRHLAGSDLLGTYRYDNQGVKARRVTVVDKGVLKSFLMSRSPIDGFPASNGHGRKMAGMSPVARQSNLIVEAESPLSRAALKQKLLDELKASGRPFGLLFDDILGGFTMTGRFIPNAFNVTPVMVYRIHPDGREELVRGVDLIGTPLTAFSHIVAADDQPAVFNGICGAESGGVPVGAVSPALYVEQIEVQKKVQSQERPPLLPAPIAAAGNR